MGDIEPVEQFPGLLHHLFLVHEQPPAVEVPEKDVLVHRQMLHQRVLLMDHRDAARGGVRGARKLDPFALVAHLGAPVRRIYARDDVHQRRLARAVFPDQRVHLSRPEREIDVLQRDDARKRLRHVFGLEDHLFHGVRLPSATSARGSP
ncbi:hypothetical protein SDC9_177346 [bioreactor metagenome]|uniref:Uncharacterized protein n=1 Tax=bioreactor metagenome TaxID=1076179 RepID=A0A645GV54_9ZZZZ